MTTPIADPKLYSPFISTDVQIPAEPDRKDIFLVDTFNRLIDSTNNKEIGIYFPTEVFNGEQWYYTKDAANPTVGKTRNGFRTIYFTPSLPNNAMASVALPIQNIDNNFVMTFAYGTATKLKTTAGTGDYFTFVGQGDARISLDITDQNIILTTTVDLSAYQAFIVMEYLRVN